MSPACAMPHLHRGAPYLYGIVTLLSYEKLIILHNIALRLLDVLQNHVKIMTMIVKYANNL